MCIWPIELGIFQILVVFSRSLVLFAHFALQLSPHPLPHSCIPPSMAAALAVSSTLGSPHFYTVHQHKPQNCLCPGATPALGSSPQPSSSRDPCSRQRLYPWGLRCSSQALRSPAHLSSHLFTSPKLLTFVLAFGSSASIGALQGQACLQRCRLKAPVGSVLLFAKQELCFVRR